jgi:alpha-N-arabinofuranosidase
MALTQARWHIWIDRPRATISPNLYGHFAEHLGRCIYEGIWVGTDSSIPNENGLRSDTIAALRALPTPVLRWPGGCFADDYHWEDGIGPRERRPRRRNRWWSGEDSNHFGTDEFIDFCRRISARPYLCVNVGSGSPTEAANWLEYCNSNGTTFYAQLRRSHGHAEPFGVRFWGVGNENWGCGGNFTPEEYAAAYRRFATFLKGRDTDVELIACGHITPDWNQRFMAALGLDQNPRVLRLIDHLSIHRYFRGPADESFTDAQYYELIFRSLQLDDDIRRTRDVLSYYGGTRKRIGIIVDEWGTWYDQARVENGLEQHNTMQDAIIAAGTLNLFNRWAEWLTMANLAQTVNVLQCVIQTAEERCWLTPTYHVFQMYAAHQGNCSLLDELTSPEYEVLVDGQSHRLPLVDASASRHPDNGQLVLSIVNRHLVEAIECIVEIHGSSLSEEGTLQQLDGDDVRARNSASDPCRVRPVSRRVTPTSREFAVILPPHSVSVLRLTTR